MTTIECKKVILRPFQESDLNDIYDYAKEEGIGEKAGWKHHQSIEVSKAVLYNQFLNKEDVFAIEYKESKRVIGSFGLKQDSPFLQDFPSLKCLEIGYVLHKDYHSRGIMSDVVKKAVEYCFDSRKCDCLIIVCCKENIPSQKVALKNGFRHYKTIENVYYPALEESKTIYCYCLERNQKKKILSEVSSS